MPRTTGTDAITTTLGESVRAFAAVKLLEDLGILVELTGQKKNRVYSYQAYVDLLSR